MRRCLSLALLSLAAATGCPSPSSTPVTSSGEGSGSCASCARRGDSGGNGGSNGSSGTSGGGSSGGGSSSSGGQGASQGSGSGGGSTGGSGGVMCSAIGGDQGSGIFDCAGPVAISGGPPGCTNPYFVSTVQDLQTCGAVCGATVQLLDPSGVPIATELSDPTSGIVEICLTGSFTYTPSTAATGYPLFYYGEIRDQLTQPLAGLGTISSGNVTAFASLLPGFNSNLASMVIYTYTLGENPKCADNAGWSVALGIPDGGAWPDGGYTVVYVDAMTGYPNPTLTATSTYGVALVMNVDPTVSDFAELEFTNPDAGACTLQNEALGFTGRLRIGAGDFSVQPIMLP